MLEVERHSPLPEYRFDDPFYPDPFKRSIKATLVGWAVGALFSGGVIAAGFTLCVMAVVVIPAWLFVVLPHALLLPRRHWLVHPKTAWFYGAIWGCAILWINQRLGVPQRVLSLSGLYNGFTLATAALTGGATAHFYTRENQEL
jgi:hypothetical protein